MRETLFRAAQQGRYFPSQETVGQYQDLALTQECAQTSFTPLTIPDQPGPAHPVMIIWPYPAGTADCVDRAACADAFLNANSTYRPVTEISLARPDHADLRAHGENLLVFAPFEALLPGMSVDDGGWLTFRGRRCDVVMSELILGYLVRAALIPFDPRRPASQLRTRIINTSSTALLKTLQMNHVTGYSDHAAQQGRDRAPIQLRALPHTTATDTAQLAEAITRLPGSRGLVVRPFSASQGTGVTFIDHTTISTQPPDKIAHQVLAAITAGTQAKYGGHHAFPLTISPFTPSVLISGCVCDLRIFVLYDRAHRGLRAVPGMVRRAQVPLADRPALHRDAAMTNLNAPTAIDAEPGPRIFPLAHQSILNRLGLTRAGLVELCRHASALWATALDNEQHFFAGRPAVFAYGSVDFLIRPDRAVVPIEMNGANVGSHPTVHPAYEKAFAAATTGALTHLGFAC